MARTLGCPRCFGVALEPHGSPSWIDGKTGWRCTDCGLSLWPRRSRLRLAGAFLLAVFITLFLYYLLYISLFKGRAGVGDGGGEGKGIGLKDALQLLTGFVVGPVGIVLIGRALFGRMPAQLRDDAVARTAWSACCSICGAGLSAANERQARLCHGCLARSRGS